MNVRDLLNAASRAEWQVEKLRSGHLRAKSPCGRFIVHVSGTPSDWRAVRKIRADFRRAGLEV